MREREREREGEREREREERGKRGEGRGRQGMMMQPHSFLCYSFCWFYFHQLSLGRFDKRNKEHTCSVEEPLSFSFLRSIYVII
jgi:hypothetical protein